MNHEEIARISLNLAKKMFHQFTNTTLEMARELITLEDNLNALSSDIPKAEDEKVKISNESNAPTIKKAPVPPPSNDDSDDLPF
jgi:hypothetical protein